MVSNETPEEQGNSEMAYSVFVEMRVLNLGKSVISTCMYFKTIYSNIHKVGFTGFLSSLACSCTEEDRHAHQSAKKKTSDHLFGFSGELYFLTGIRCIMNSADQPYTRSGFYS